LYYDDRISQSLYKYIQIMGYIVITILRLIGVWGIRDSLDRRIGEAHDKESAEKICKEHNKCLLEE